MVARLAQEHGFCYSVQVMPITVAALMTPRWLAGRLTVPAEATEVLLPGYCLANESDVQQLQSRHGQASLRIGPRDLYDLPEFFGGPARDPSGHPSGYGTHSIEILAEINHAPRLGIAEVVRQATDLAEQGADVIDVGCDPDGTWSEVGTCVRELRDAGLRVSIDSFRPDEVQLAVRHGAELVLSVNRSNRRQAVHWGCDVVVVPDQVGTLIGLDETLEWLERHDVRYRIDPVLEPIGCGLAESLRRYLQVRDRYPDAEILMGIGNVTELTDADSAAINVLLLGLCQELAIGSVLTTQVINWARTSVRECDLGRRLVHYAVSRKTPPKHVEPNLVLLRDPKVLPVDVQWLDQLARQVRDPNFRLFADVARERLHLVTRKLHLEAAGPFELLQLLLAEMPETLTIEHAFYLGYELCKAMTAVTLGKQYRQDEALRWGFLTRPEPPGRPSPKDPTTPES